MSIAQQIVWITGASRGIGRTVAERFAAAGAFVVGTATTTAGAAAIHDYLTLLDARGVGLVLDVTDSQQCQLLFERVLQEYGAPTILVNNAGVTRDHLLLRMPQAAWDEVINTHLNALYTLCKLMIKPMLKVRYGRIINIGSVVGSTGNAGQVNYAAAKAGMIGFSKALALELASRAVTVNVVAPGYIQTDMTAGFSEEQQAALLRQIPMQRIGLPEEVAHAVYFLASKEAAYITGQVLHVNGGMF